MDWIEKERGHFPDLFIFWEGLRQILSDDLDLSGSKLPGDVGLILLQLLDTCNWMSGALMHPEAHNYASHQKTFQRNKSSHDGPDSHKDDPSPNGQKLVSHLTRGAKLWAK